MVMSELYLHRELDYNAHTRLLLALIYLVTFTVFIEHKMEEKTVEGY